MKKRYSTPKMLTLNFGVEALIAESVQMERGTGSGGNTPKVKGEYPSSSHSQTVQWDDWR